MENRLGVLRVFVGKSIRRANARLRAAVMAPIIICGKYNALAKQAKQRYQSRHQRTGAQLTCSNCNGPIPIAATVACA
jgi:hypothetical protein